MPWIINLCMNNDSIFIASHSQCDRWSCGKQWSKVRISESWLWKLRKGRSLLDANRRTLGLASDHSYHSTICRCGRTVQWCKRDQRASWPKTENEDRIEHEERIENEDRNWRPKSKRSCVDTTWIEVWTSNVLLYIAVVLAYTVRSMYARIT